MRLHLVRHRTALKNRIHSSLLAFGHPCPVSDLFVSRAEALLARLEFPEPWLGDIEASLRLIDAINFQITEIEDELVADGADHPYVPLLRTAPGIGHVLGYTIAAEIGDIERFASPTKLCGYTGLCSRVYQSGEADHRGSLRKKARSPWASFISPKNDHHDWQAQVVDFQCGWSRGWSRATQVSSRSASQLRSGSRRDVDATRPLDPALS